MAQINLHVNAQFEEDLRRLQRLRGVRTKSEAIRLAVHESLERAIESAARTDFRTWLGLGVLAPLNPSPRFRSHDDLWD